MFDGATAFVQDLVSWDLSSSGSRRLDMFQDSDMPCDNFSFYPPLCTGEFGCRNTGCPVRPFTDTGGEISLQEAVTLFVMRRGELGGR